jgi:hypothetical protein
MLVAEISALRIVDDCRVIRLERIYEDASSVHIVIELVEG